jgi:hypothetical protein
MKIGGSPDFQRVVSVSMRGCAALARRGTLLRDRPSQHLKGRTGMRSFAYLCLLALLIGGNTAACLAQQPTSPATLEGLLNSDEGQKPAVAADAGTKRPAGTLARPKDGVQHPDLDKAWVEYDAVVAKAAESIKAGITKQFDAATAKGDLDAAEKWQKAIENFEKAGEVPSGSEMKAAVSAAVADCKRAKDELTKAYEAVVKALTMEKKIADAKAVRGELRLLKGEGEPVPDKAAQVVFLSDLPEIDAVVGYGEFGKRGQVGCWGFKIIVNDEFSPHGICTHCKEGGEAGVTYDVPPKAGSLQGKVALPDCTKDKGGAASNVAFRIVGERGNVLWRSPRAIQRSGEVIPFEINVAGHKRIRLIAVCDGKADWAQASWIEPRFVLSE